MARRAKPPAFEAVLEELERVVDRLERGELPLEESLAAFEHGMGLVSALTERLGEIEHRVDVLLAAYEPAADGPSDADGDDEDDR